MARRTGLVLILAIGGLLMLVLASVGAADHGKGNGKGKSRSAEAKLDGYSEVPSISTTGRGKLKLKIKNSTSIDFKLSYSGLSTPAAASHIHFAETHVNGGISAFLCGAPKPACPAGNNGNKVTVTGTILAADVLQTNAPGTAASQGIAPGEIAELIAAIKAGATYVNVHTATYPGGEIRGQIGRGDDD